MQLTKIEKNGITCAIVNSSELVITDTQTALDVLMSAKYDIGTKNIERAKNTADLAIVSPQAKGNLVQALHELRKTIADLLSEMEDM